MEQPPKKKIKYICLVCDQVFDRSQRLHAHQKQCDISDKVFCGVKNFNDHRRHTHAINPTRCSTCFKEFPSNRDLKIHQKNASIIDCSICEKKFCHQADYNKHRIVEHCGGGADNSEDEEYESILTQKIFAANVGLDNDEDYKHVVQINKPNIEDKVVDRKIYMTVNKELTADFTYKDLKDIIVQAVGKYKTVMKFYIGFGIVLKNVNTSEYRYYYVSSNHMLFNRAKTINTLSDVNDIIKEIYDMNISEHYYMLRPSSGWSLVKITNVFFKLFNLYHPLG